MVGRGLVSQIFNPIAVVRRAFAITRKSGALAKRNGDFRSCDTTWHGVHVPTAKVMTRLRLILLALGGRFKFPGREPGPRAISEPAATLGSVRETCRSLTKRAPAGSVVEL